MRCIETKRFLVTSDCISNFGTAKQFEPQPNCKYNKNSLKLGFVVKLRTETMTNSILQSVICQETLSNQSMKPPLLKHL